MVTLLTKKLKRNLRVIMSPRRIAYMVCLARVSKNLIIEVLIDTTGQRLISINQPTIMVSIMANNTQLQTFFMGFKIIIMVIFFMLLCTTKPLELMAKKYFLPYIMPLCLMIKKLYSSKSLLCTVKTNQFSIMQKN